MPLNNSVSTIRVRGIDPGTSLEDLTAAAKRLYESGSSKRGLLSFSTSSGGIVGQPVRDDRLLTRKL